MKKFVDSLQPKKITIMEAAKLFEIGGYFPKKYTHPNWHRYKYPIKEAIQKAHMIANVKY